MSIATSTAIAIGGVAAAAGGVASGVLASKGAGKQASAAERSSQAAIDEQRREFDTTQKNLQPWLTAGSGAMQNLQFLLGIGVPPGQAITSTAKSTGIPPDKLSEMIRGPQYTDMGDRINSFRNPGARPMPLTTGSSTSSAAPATGVPGGMNASDFGSLSRDFSASDFTADPGYDFRLSEGAKALERSAASRGSVLSGGTLKALTRYNQDFASNEFGNAYNRFQSNRATRFNQLASIAGLGQTTASTLGNLGQQNASTIGNLIVGGQTAAAAARASGYNAWGNALSGIGNNLSNWYMLSKMNQPSIPTG